MNEITYKKQMIKEMNQLHAEHGLEKPEKAQKSPEKPGKAQKSPKPEKAQSPKASKFQGSGSDQQTRPESPRA